MIAIDFTRDDCQLGRKRKTYATLQREYRCNECGGGIAMKWEDSCESYPEGWHVVCGHCGSHDFIHEAQYRQERREAREVLAGLPEKVARLLK